MRVGWILVMLLLTANGQSAELSNKDRQSSTRNHKILVAHNAVRSELNLPLLQWSDDLATSKKWADRLMSENRFVINPDTPHGQNLFMLTGGSTSPAAVVWSWASESQNYDYESNSCTGVCGHYTQLVWRSTTRVGCAVARAKNREVWVCEYDPPGNEVGQLPY